jgi:hypothetical protein
MSQSDAGLIRNDTGMTVASTRAKPLFAARRPEISGEGFSTLAVIIDSTLWAVHEGIGMLPLRDRASGSPTPPDEPKKVGAPDMADLAKLTLTNRESRGGDFPKNVTSTCATVP